jgi:serine/threonine protein kinase
MIFEATDRRSKRRVAVKLMSPARGEEGLMVRIQREIRILSELTHPHVVACHGSGRLPDGRLYLILDWLSGEDLADFKAKQPVSLHVALEIARQIADALSAAHARGIIHRDIKPANIFLIEPKPNEPPDVRVLDFGVAKAPTESDEEEEQLRTRTGAVLGTPTYMAPEQANTAGKVDERADVFSLGVVIYELITGRLPFNSRSDLARLARIQVEPAIPIKDVAGDLPELVADLVDGMLKQRREDRIPTMRIVEQRAAECLRRIPPALLETVFNQDPKLLGEFMKEPTRAVDLSRVRSDVLSARALDPAEPPSDSTEIAPARSRRAKTPQTSVQDRDSEWPIFGRTTLIDRLKDRLRPEPKSPSRTLVVGPAGIGKSRLRLELQRLALAQPGGPAVLAGRAEEGTRSTPFGFLRILLGAKAGIVVGDTADVREQKLHRLLPNREEVTRLLLDAPCRGRPRSAPSEERTRFAQVEAWTERPSMVAVMADAFEVSAGGQAEIDDRDAIAAFLAEALEVAIPEASVVKAARGDPRLMGAEARRALDLVLRGMSKKNGLVVLADDAHLIDDESAFVLRELVRPDRGVQVSLLAFGLPNLVDATSGNASILASEDCVVVDVPPLEAEPARSVVRSLLDGPIEGDALEILVQRAQGNPLHLIQLVRAVRDTVVLSRTSGADPIYALTGLRGDPGDLDRVPATIAAAVRARLSKMPTVLQRVLSAAAVLGDVFWLEAVASMLDERPEAIRAAMDQLTAQDFVRPRSRSRYVKTIELEFTHAVIRSVVLSRLKKQRREALELAAAAHLDTRGETDAAILAQHRAAGGELHEAGALYAEAASKAIGAGAFASAVALTDRALRMVEGAEIPLELRRRLLDLSSRSLEFGEDFEAADRALIALDALDIPDEQRARVIERRSRLALRRRLPGLARKLGGIARERFMGLDVPLAQAEARVSEAEALELLGDGRAALREMIGAHSAFEAAAFRRGLSRSTSGLARIALCSGDYRNAEARWRESLVHARATSDLSGISHALLGLAEVSRRIGQYERASEFIVGAERTAAESVQGLLTRIARGLLLAESGELPRAEETLLEVERAADGCTAWSGAWCSALLSRSQLLVAFRSHDAEPELKRSGPLAERFERALAEAEETAPLLLLPLELHLAYQLAQLGSRDRARSLSQRASDRFSKEGAVAEDEAPLVVYTHALTLIRIGASREECARVLEKAIENLDLILNRLTSKMRERYLERAPIRGLVKAAEKYGLVVEKDAKTFRVRVAS